MKKTAFAFFAALVLFFTAGLVSCADSTSSDSGDSSSVDSNATATDAEKAVITEMNYARTKPAEYVTKKLQPLVSKSSGSYLTALNECISQMNSMPARGELSYGQGLYLAAKEWVNEQGKGSSTGHQSGWDSRIGKYCSYTKAGENIAYGYNSAEAIVIALLVDDGVDDRGHRKNILELGGYGPYTHAGVAIGSHARYDTMCCIDFASGYAGK